MWTDNKQNLEGYISRLTEDETKQLESGFITKPKIKEVDENYYKTNQNKPKNNHKNGVFTKPHLFDDIKR